MRGTYTATYLDRVAVAFAKRRGITALDLGAAFDLIVGTSTGGIIACALAAGVPLSDIVNSLRRTRIPDFLASPALRCARCHTRHMEAATRTSDWSGRAPQSPDQ